MKLTLKLLLFMFPLLVLAACGDSTASSQPVAPEGPTLIMFYTDN